MKYIMMQITSDTGLVRKVPFLFPEFLAHAEMEQLARSGLIRAMFSKLKSLHTGSITCVSAGFCNGTYTCYGESESLGLKSSSDDSNIINTYNYLHGIQT